MKNESPIIWLQRNLLNPLLIVVTLFLGMLIFGVQYSEPLPAAGWNCAFPLRKSFQQD